MIQKYQHERLQRPEDFLYEIADLKAGDHLCCIYRTEEEHRAVFTPFIMAGLKNNEKVLYFTDVRTAKKIEKYFAAEDLDIKYYIEKGQFLILTAYDAYLKEDEFDPEKIIELLTSETNQALESGYSALRVTGEMTWALRGHPGSERLIEYEARLNEFFPHNKCLAVCQYDMRKFETDVLLDVLRTHPLAIVGKEVYKNIYYIPPDELLGPELEKAKLQHWLNNLKKYNQTRNWLRESDRMFLTLIQNLPGFVYRCKNDSDWTMEYISESVTMITGFTPAEIKKRTYAKTIHPDDRDMVWEKIQKALEKKIPFRIHYRIETKNGDYRWVLEQGCGVFLKNGTLRNLEGYVSDVNDERQAKEDRDRFFNLTSDLICFASVDGYFKYVNPVWSELLGYSKQELLTRPFLDFILPDDHSKNNAEVQQLLAGKQSVGFENRYVHKNGSVRVINWNATPLVEEGVFYCIGRDVTEERRTQQTLAENESRLRSAQKAGKIGTWEFDLEKELWTVSDEFCRIHGITSQHIYMDELFSLIFEDDLNAFQNAFQNTLQNRESYYVEHRIMNKSSHAIRWVVKRGELIFDEKNNPIKLVGTTQDITEKKIAEIELKRQKELAQYYLDVAGVIIVVLDTKQNVILINRKGSEILGYPVNEIIGKNWFDTFLPKTNVDEVKMVFDKLVAGEIKPVEYFENVIVNSDGTRRLIAWHNAILKYDTNYVAGILSSGLDITEKRKAEEALKQGKRLLSDMGGMAKIAGWEHDLVTGKAEWTDALYDIIEIERGATPPGVSDHLGYYPEEDRVILEREYQRAINEQIPFDLELRVYTANGKLLWCHVYGEPIIENGKCVKLRGVFQDITERKKIKESLKKSEANYRLLAENVNDVIWTMTANGKFLYVSPSIERLRGYTVEEVMKQPLEEVLTPESFQLIKKEIENLAKQQQEEVRNSSSVIYEIEMSRKDGSTVWTEVVANNIYDSEGNFLFILGVARDITDRKRAERELRENEERFRKIVQNMPVLINAFDENQNYIFWNKECEKVTGYSAKEIIDNSAVMEMLYPDKLYLNSIMDDWKNKGNDFENWEIALTTKSGQKKIIAWFNLSDKVPIPGWETWAIGFDVTDRNKARQDVEKKNVELEKFNKLMVGREIRMIELKQEINSLLEKLDIPKKYKASEQVELAINQTHDGK